MTPSMGRLVSVTLSEVNEMVSSEEMLTVSPLTISFVTKWNICCVDAVTRYS